MEQRQAGEEDGKRQLRELDLVPGPRAPARLSLLTARKPQGPHAKVLSG